MNACSNVDPEYIPRYPKPKPVAKKIRPPPKKENSRRYILHLSDWHYDPEYKVCFITLKKNLNLRSVTKQTAVILSVVVHLMHLMKINRSTDLLVILAITSAILLDHLRKVF